MSEPGAISAATIGKAADEGSAGTLTRVGAQFRPADQSDPAPLALDLDPYVGAEMGEHFLGVVARGLALDDGRRSARVEAGEQHGGLDLRRSDRRAVEDRRRLGGASSA